MNTAKRAFPTFIEHMVRQKYADILDEMKQYAQELADKEIKRILDEEQIALPLYYIMGIQPNIVATSDYDLVKKLAPERAVFGK